jgi:hypothetical protein
MSDASYSKKSSPNTWLLKEIALSEKGFAAAALNTTNWLPAMTFRVLNL